MYTVIIAEKSTLDLFERFNMYLAPLLNEDIAFCEWNRAGKSFDEMLPDIYDKVSKHREWRAIIVNQSDIEKQNPFDWTEYKPNSENEGVDAWETLYNQLQGKLSCYEKAIKNPLTQITTSLCGAPVSDSSIEDYEAYSGLVLGNMKSYEYLLETQLDNVDLSSVVTNFTLFGKERLRKFVSSEQEVDELIKYIREKNFSKIHEMVSDKFILELIALIGDNDPIYSDPEYLKCTVENTKKIELFKSISDVFSFKDVQPTEVTCVSLRTFDYEAFDRNVKWQDNDENRYSRFAENNLYPQKLRYLLFDIVKDDSKLYLSDQIRFLCFLLVLAGNTVPKGLLNNGKVYRANVVFDDVSISCFCKEYIAKLKATLARIDNLEKKLLKDREKILDDETAEKLFETGISVEARTAKESEKKELFAEYSTIGMAADCPQDEMSFWDGQYNKISKRFIRYLREPRRAVKNAATGDFKKLNEMDDDRALLLTESQRENILYKMQEDEQQMVETRTEQLYNIAAFNEIMQKADKDLRRGIGQRMTRKKTVTVGLIAIAAYLVGFLPLLFGNLNTSKSFLFSLLITVITLFIFALCGFVYLRVLRKRLINRFKHFNYEMSVILKRVDGSLSKFSQYLSHACNIMRGVSVLEYPEGTFSKKLNVFQKHKRDILFKIDEVENIFSAYLSTKTRLSSVDIDPFNYDYSVLSTYDYNYEYPVSRNNIELFQHGNEVQLPVDYVNKITFVREELYE